MQVSALIRFIIGRERVYENEFDTFNIYSMNCNELITANIRKIFFNKHITKFDT